MTEPCCLVTDHRRVHWVTAPTARVVADLAERDRTRRRTHHVSAVVASGNKAVVHLSSDRDVVRALVTAVLG